VTAGVAGLRNRALSWLVLAKQLPGFAPFAPLVWAALRGRTAVQAASEPAGGLSAPERGWLAEQARRAPPAGVIVQAGPPEAVVTCALAEGCWGSRRRVYVLWPEAAAAGPDFRAWHRAIIQRGLAPYVTPVQADGAWEGACDLLYAGESRDSIETARPGTLVVIRGPLNSGNLELVKAGACGLLTALQVAPGREEPPPNG